MSDILIVGGSSGIGAEVARQAAAAGFGVRCMSRSGAVPQDVAGDGFAGDARQQHDVAQALVGINAVVQSLGIPLGLDMLTKPVTLFSEATRVLLPLMQDAGVRRLITVTGFGAGDSHRAIHPLQRLPFRLAFKNPYDDKSIQEQMISDSDLNWLIVRPGVLTNGRRSGAYRVLRKRDEWRNGIISRADVADFIVSQLGADGLVREKPVLIRRPLGF